jgi:transcriptional regulator with XRE-family HTH domain
MVPTFLRVLRLRLGLTQDELAARSGVHQSTISKYETQHGLTPTFGSVVALAKALRVDPLYIKFGPEPPKRRAGVEHHPTPPPEAS